VGNTNIDLNGLYEEVIGGRVRLNSHVGGRWEKIKEN
jgi:hypothetical protein